MSKKLNIVTIDGPAGVGKSTVSKKVASLLGFTYLDTGAMYRGVGLYLQQKGVELTDIEQIDDVLSHLDLQLVPAKNEKDDVGVLLDGEDVSTQIRSAEMAMLASEVSAIPVVRQVLTKIQKSIGSAGKIVAEGRDTGTVVFPRAAHKFFLDAQPEERAKRRVIQQREKGVETDYNETLAMILTRDKNDTERALAPLKQAEDATLVDTTSITIEEVVAKVVQEIRKK